MATVDKVLDEIAGLMLDPRQHLSVFVGAGISDNYPSNLPLARALTTWTLEALIKCAPGRPLEGRVHEAIEQVLSLRPEIFFHELTAELGPVGLLPLRVYECGWPNSVHQFLALALARRLISVIVTTNFDLLIERAYESLPRTVSPSPGLTVLREPAQYQRRSVPRDGDWPPTLFKLHGSVLHGQDSSDLGTIQIALDQVGQPFGRGRTRTLRSVLERHHLLVLGYSGADEFDILPVFLNARSSQKIYWLEHSNRRLSLAPTTSRKDREVSSYCDRILSGRINKEKVRGSARELVGRLASKLGFSQIKVDYSLPALETIQGRYRAKYFDAWAANLAPSAVLAALGRLLNRAQRPELSARVYEAAAKRAADARQRLSYIGRCGWVLHDSGDSARAIRCFRRAASLARFHGLRKEEARALRDWAWPLKALAERGERGAPYLQSARHKLCQSRVLLESLAGQQESVLPELARTMRDLAWISVTEGDLDAALEHLQVSLDLYGTTADPREVAWTLRDLAAVLRRRGCPGDIDHAIQYLGEAERAFKRVGDVHNAAWTRRDRAHALYAEGSTAAAFKEFRTAYELSLAAGDYVNAGVTLGDYALKLLDQGREPREGLSEAISLLQVADYQDRVRHYQHVLELLERT